MKRHIIMKGLSQKSILVSGIIIVLFVIVVGAYLVQTAPEPSSGYQEPQPEAVVHQYFTAWNNKDWPNMYATISDGFKKIEPTAKDLAIFRSYASSQAIDGVRIVTIKETSNDLTTASVDYSVEFILPNGSTRPFRGTFTLKFRPGDVIRGWKLVHPYGPNVDTS